MEICPGSEWFKPHIGRLGPGVQHREDKPACLVGGPVALTGGLWEAWTPLVKSAQTLALEAG